MSIQFVSDWKMRTNRRQMAKTHFILSMLTGERKHVLHSSIPYLLYIEASLSLTRACSPNAQTNNLPNGSKQWKIYTRIHSNPTHTEYAHGTSIFFSQIAFTVVLLHLVVIVIIIIIVWIGLRVPFSLGARHVGCHVKMLQGAREKKQENSARQTHTARQWDEKKICKQKTKEN